MSISEILMLLTLIVTIVHVTFEITWKLKQREKHHDNDKKEKVTASASPSHGHLIFWSFDP
ncbi:MAG: hypothetical protein ACLRVX_11895 [Faecalibacterium sp.]